MERTTRDVEQLMSDYLDLWNGDYSKLEVVSESTALYHPNAPEEGIHGRDALEAHIRELYDAFPDHHLAIDDMLPSDEVVMTEWTMTGTHEGEYNGLPPTEREIELTGMGKTMIATAK